jgi:hypothetical protein
MCCSTCPGVVSASVKREGGVRGGHLGDVVRDIVDDVHVQIIWSHLRGVSRQGKERTDRDTHLELFGESLSGEEGHARSVHLGELAGDGRRRGGTPMHSLQLLP